MKTSILLTESRAILDDHSALVQGETDDLWSNERIMRQLNEAQMILCRQGLVLIDKTTAQCCDITLVEDQAEYTLDPVVLQVWSAILSDSDSPLTRRNWNHIHPKSIAEPEFWDTNRSLVWDAGRPSVYVMDGANDTIELWRKPDATSALLTLNLRVSRLPLIPLSLADDNEPEVREEWHQMLALYAAGYLLSHTANNDVTEGGEGRKLGQDMLAEFYRAVNDARRDLKRTMQSAPRWRFGAWAKDGG